MGLPVYQCLRQRFLVAVLCCFAFAWIARADEMKCAVCGQPIHEEFFWIEDKVEGTKQPVCKACDILESRCFICGLPVRDDFKRLPDGRYICARELKTVISSETDAREICHGVKDDLDRLLSRFLTMPTDESIQLSIVDKYHLENLFTAPGNENSHVWIYGATSSRSVADHKHAHTIDILSDLQKPRLMAVCAHEYTHAWMGENCSRERLRSLDKNIVEAFCELVAYKYMDSLHEQGEMENIKKNNYTVGKILVLIEADNEYGFNTVMDWIKDGEDTTVELANLDRIRALRDQREIPTVAAYSGLYYGAPTAMTAAPKTLVLKGISGSPRHRFAIINDATFETMEKASVHVGNSELTVKCLGIGNDYVTIQVEGSPEKKQLFLQGSQ